MSNPQTAQGAFGVPALLLNDATATGPPVFWPGGIAAFAVQGTFGGATVSLEVLQPDGVTYIAVGSSTTVTANAFVTGLNLPIGSYKAVVSGGTPSALYASLEGVSD